MNDHAISQAVYKAHIKFGEENPEWMKMALDIVNRWGRHEVTLAHAIAEGLMEAHQMGQNGDFPEPPPRPGAQVRRRTPPPTIPETTTSHVIRRTR